MYNKNPSYFYYTKKGKLKEITVKNKSYVYFYIHKKFEVVLKKGGNNKVQKPRSTVKIKNKELTKTIYDENIQFVYKIKFEDLINALKDDKLNKSTGTKLFAVNTSTGVRSNVWEICSAIGLLCNKDDKIISNIRFDL